MAKIIYKKGLEGRTEIGSKASVTQDWDNDGYLKISGAKTLGRYLELKELKYKAPMKDFGIFFAFSRAQFDEGYAELVRSGKIKDGDKVVRSVAGGFAAEGATEKLLNYFDGIDAKIKADCDPQEVYWYECNNYECNIAYDGDNNAMKVIIGLFGREAAESIERLNAMDSIDEIDAEMRKRG